MTDNGKKLMHTSEVMVNDYNEMETKCIELVKEGKLKRPLTLVVILEVYLQTSERVRSLADELLCSSDEDDKDLAVGILEKIQDIVERGELLINYLEENDPKRG